MRICLPNRKTRVFSFSKGLFVVYNKSCHGCEIENILEYYDVPEGIDPFVRHSGLRVDD